MGEGRRHHTGDRVGPAIELDCRTDDIGSRIEPPAPEAIAQHDQVVPAGAAILASERAAHRRRRAEHREQSRRELPANQSLRPDGAGDGIRSIPERFDGFEYLRPLLPDVQVEARALRVLPALRVPGRDPHQPVRIAVGKGSQEDAVDDGEHRCRGADAERDGQDRDDGKPQVAPERAKCRDDSHARDLASWTVSQQAGLETLGSRSQRDADHGDSTGRESRGSRGSNGGALTRLGVRAIRVIGVPR